VGTVVGKEVRSEGVGKMYGNVEIVSGTLLGRGVGTVVV
jgi:hypothetical protein